MTSCKSVPPVDLTALKTIASELEPKHPLRILLGTLPRELGADEYLAILPFLWRTAEQA